MKKIMDKIRKSGWGVAIALSFCILAGSVLFLTGCGADNSGIYTIQVKTEGQKALEKIAVYVYADESLEDMVTVAKTDEEGKVSFESEDAMGCVIVLKDVPAGYQLEEIYEIKEKDTQIVLQTEFLSMDRLTGATLGLGDVFADMSVTATDGKTYTISELLEEKEAVVLNFWYLQCNPCRMEFPYLKEAYENYKDEIEVLALNPYDGTTEKVLEYQNELELTFPMAAVVEEWQVLMGIESYPTTVVIDRYGTIAFIHKGYVTDTESFEKVFKYFTADDYKQTTVKYLEDFK